MKGDSVMDTRKKMLGSRLLAGLLSLVLVVGMLPAASADSYQDGYIKGDLICSITDDTSEGEILICKKEEGHTHGKECYEDTDTDQKNPTCGKEENHLHSNNKSDCYHTHTNDCWDWKPPVIEVKSITLTPKSATINIGEDIDLNVTIEPEDASDQSVTWRSSDSNIASVSSNGKVTGVGAGNVTITVTTNDGNKIDSCNITVNPAATDKKITSISLSGSNSVAIGQNITLTTTILPEDATNKTLEWSSSDPQKATVDQNGVVRGVAEGDVTITAKAKDGSDVTGTHKVKVTNANVLATGVTLNKTTASIGVNETLQLTATVKPDNATNKTIDWTSSNDSVVSVNANGLVTGKKAGTATITAKVKDSNPAVTATCTVTVTANSLTISPTSLTMSLSGSGSTGSIKGTTVPSTFAKNITWTTNNRNIVAVGSSNSSSYTGATCNLYAKGTGTATITAEVTINGQKFSKSCSVTVGNIADTIEYSTNGDDVVHFVASDFNRVCNDVFGGSTRLDYIVFTSVPSSYGTLYYDYSTNTGRGEKVTDTSNSSNNYGYNSSSTYYKRLIEDLTFVPQSSTDRTITIEYTGYVNNSRDSFTGKIEITIGASGNLNYTIAKNDILELDADDFNSFFKKSSSTSGSLDYIVFNKLPSSSSGTLYFKYDKDSNRNTAVARNEKYYDRGTDAIDDVTFVAADGYTGTVTIPFTAYGSGSNNNVSGTLSIKVGKKGDSDIAYTTDRNTPVQVNIRDFNQFCEDATGDSRVDYVTFSLPSSNRGTLYGVYSSSNSSSQNTALKSSTRCYRNPGSKDIALDDVTFVPASGYTGTVSISFSGYSSSGKKFSGTMKITVGKDSGDITYTADSGQVITFKLADFTEYCKDELGSKATLDYVTFDQPAASKGTLYYDYSNNSGTQVKSSTRYYRNEKPYLDQVSFVPARNLTGTVQIPFSGRSTAKEEFEGVIVINYNTIKEPGVIRYTTNGSPVPFSLQDFTRACNERGGAQLDFVKFPIPDSTCGKLYSGYRSAAQNSGQISPNLTYRVSGTPPLAEVVFVPKAGYTGLARLNYTGTDKNGTEFSGVVEITITAPTSSGTFADVGANYSWAAASVDYLYRAGVVTGTDATHFAPAQNITRGDFVLMLYRAFGLQNAGTASFADVPQDSYYAQAIAAAKAMGIATGGGGGTFNPTSPLTRQDAMLLIQRTINATGGSLRDGAEASLSTFADRGNVAPYAQGAVSALVQAGIIKGDNAGRLNPTGSLSRAEMATILHRVLTM